MRLRLIHLGGGRRHHCDHFAAWGARIHGFYMPCPSARVDDMETSSLPSRWLRPREPDVHLGPPQLPSMDFYSQEKRPRLEKPREEGLN